VEALELAKLARILVSKLDFSGSDPLDGDTHSVGNLISERLFQLFQICLAAIGRYSGDSVLRTVYYSICFRYISGMADPTGPLAASRHKASNAVHIYGERLLNVVCDDATGGDVACQTAALILLNGLVAMGIQEGDGHVIDAMNRLNFVGILVDSLKHVLADWMAVIDSGE
jgi:nuclear pore complex protein Nup205